MIPPPFAHRFEGDSGVDIATQEIDVVFPDGERRRVVLRIGAPFVKENITWVRSELENLDRTDGPVASEGTLHTLLIGLRWITCRLKVFEEKHHCRYYWPDSESPYDYQALFSTAPFLSPPSPPPE